MTLQSREAEWEKEVSATVSKEIDVRQEERIRFEMKFAAAYEQSRDAVYGYLVYMTRDASLAEDLSQEVFLRMFLHLDKFRGEAKVRTWALRIARNVFLSYAKKKRPCLLEEQEWEQEWEPEADINRNLPEEEMLRKEEAQRVRECLMCLGEQERTVLLLRDFEELSYEEVAKIMNLTTEVVKSRLYRARKKFRKIYEAGGKRDNKGQDVPVRKIYENSGGGESEENELAGFSGLGRNRRASGEAVRNGRDKWKEADEQHERRQ